MNIQLKIRKRITLLLAALITLTIIPVSAFSVFAYSTEKIFDFFTAVAISNPDGTALTGTTRRDAELLVSLDYEIPQTLKAGQYSFSLPQSVTSNYSSGTITLALNGRASSTVDIKNNGDCIFNLGEAVTDTVSPPASTASSANTNSSDIVSSDAESEEASSSNTSSNNTASPATTSSDTVQVVVKSAEAVQQYTSGQISFITKLDSKKISADAKAITFKLGSQVFEAEIELAQAKVLTGAKAAPPDFSQYFTDVKITTETDASLPDPLSKEAKVKVEASYSLTEGDCIATGTEYGFTLPVALSKRFAATGGNINLEYNGLSTGTVKIGADGTCTILFTDPSAAQTNGKFYFQTTLAKKEIPNGTSGFTIPKGTGGDTIEIPVNFMLDQITGTLEITNTADAATNLSDKLIKWEVAVTPDLKNADLALTSPSIGNLKELVGFTVNNTIDSALTLVELNDSAYKPKLVDKDGAEVSSAVFSENTVGGKKALVCTLPDGEYTDKAPFKLTYYTRYGLEAFEEKDGKLTVKNNASASFKHHLYSDDASSNNITLKTGDNSTKAVSAAKEGTTDIEMYLLSKENNYNAASHNIAWTVTVNGRPQNGALPAVPPLTFGNDFAVTDIIPSGLKLTGVTLNGTSLTENAPSNGYTFTKNNGGNVGYEGGNLVIPVTDSATHIIKYTTEIDPVIWKNEANKTFNNKVSYNPGVGSGVGFSRIKSAECSFAGASGGMLAANGAYDRSNHTFTWTIGVNGGGTGFSNNGTVTITIPEGLTYDPAVSGNLVFPQNWANTWDSTDRKITVTVPNIENGIITLKTTVDDNKVWAVNRLNSNGTLEEIPHKIDTKLESTAEGINLSVSPIANAKSEVIKKSSNSSLDYNHNTKTLTWRIDYNQNMMAMTGISITDILQSGLSYVAGSAKLDGSNSSALGVNYDDANRKLTFTPPDTTTGQAAQYITFDTLVNESLLAWSDGNSSSKITNEASITFNEAPASPTLGTLSAAHERYVGKRPLTKSGISDKDKRNYTWTVEINPNLITMRAPELVDMLDPNLILDFESIKLYEADVNNTNGNLTKESNTPVYDGGSPEAYPDYTATLTGQKFTFKFIRNTNKAYLLIFDTDNMNPYSTSYTNKVYFAGDEASSAGSSSDLSQAAASGGSTNVNRGTIKLTAKENNTSGKVLAGIKYTVTGAKGFTYSVVTGADGVALFTPLKFDTYTVTEDISNVSEYSPLQPTPVCTIVIDNPATDQIKESFKAVELYYTKGNKVYIDYEPGKPGATGNNPARKNYGKGVTVTVLENMFSLNGYEFVNWNTSADGTGTAYSPSDSIKLDADVTLYAQWNKKPNANNGSNNNSGYRPSYSPPTIEPEPEIDNTPDTLPTAPGWTKKSLVNAVNVSYITQKPLAKGSGGLVLSAVTKNGAVIPGVVFEVTSEGLSHRAATDKNGIVEFPNIKPGKYTVRVLSMPSTMTFHNGQLLDAKVPLGRWAAAEAEFGFDTFTPKTGDSFPVSSIIIMAIAAFAFFLVTAYSIYSTSGKRTTAKALNKEETATPVFRL